MNLIKLTADYVSGKGIPESLNVIKVRSYAKSVVVPVMFGGEWHRTLVDMHGITVDRNSEICTGFSETYKVFVIGPRREIKDTKKLRSEDIRSAWKREGKTKHG